MTETRPDHMLLSTLLKITAVLSAFLGLIVIIGWHTDSLGLIQVRPAFVPMQYNTALGFLLCGLGLGAQNFGWHRVTGAAATVLVVLGVMTLAEYMFHLSLGIDELVMTHYVTTATVFPGRMALSTAICFSLSGTALLLAGIPMAFGRRLAGADWLIGMTAALVIALGAAALGGYISGVETAYGWGRFSSMAAHTAAGFIVVGSGLVATAWRRASTFTHGPPPWVPALGGMGAATVTVVLWQALVAKETALLRDTVESSALQATGLILAHVQHRNTSPEDLAVEQLLQDALFPLNLQSRYTIELLHKQILLGAIGTVDPAGTVLAAETSVDLPNMSWRLVVTPTEQTIDKYHSGVPVIALYGGLAGSALLALALWLLQRLSSRSRDRELSDMLMRAIVENAHEGIILVDEVGAIESFNASAERIFGYSKEQVLGQNVRMLMPEPDHSQHDQYLRNYLDTGEAQIIGTGREVKGRRQDGSVFAMELAVAELDLHGRRVFVGSVRDVDQARQADRIELALTDVRTRLLEASTELDQVLDVDLLMRQTLRSLDIHVRNVSFQTPGVTPRHFESASVRPDQGGTFRTLLSQEVPLADFFWIGQAWDSGEAVVLDEVALRAGGLPEHVKSLVEVPLMGGGSVGFNSEEADAFNAQRVAIIRRLIDAVEPAIRRELTVTIARQDAYVQAVHEVVLRMASEEEFASVVQAVESGLQQLGIDPLKVRLHILQGEPDQHMSLEFCGGKLEPISAASTVSQERVRRWRSKAAWERPAEPSQTDAATTIDVPFVHGTLEVWLKSTPGMHGRFILLLQRVCNQLSLGWDRVQDMTTRRQAQEQLAMRAAELERSQTELQHLLFAASHDLQEPVRMVTGFTQLLARELPADLSEDSREYMQFVMDGAARMKELLSALLRYSQILGDGIQPRHIQCASVVSQAVEQHRVRLEQLGGQVDIDEPLPQIHADPDKLSIVFEALIDNAITYCASDRPPKVRVSAVHGPTEVELTVSDNGIGMEAAHLDRVFGLFRRLHHARDIPGTGMGLTLAKTIVEQHGGRIWIESDHQVGSVVHLVLPNG